MFMASDQRKTKTKCLVLRLAAPSGRLIHNGTCRDLLFPVLPAEEVPDHGESALIAVAQEHLALPDDVRARRPLLPRPLHDPVLRIEHIQAVDRDREAVGVASGDVVGGDPTVLAEPMPRGVRVEGILAVVIPHDVNLLLRDDEMVILLHPAD
eukprot:CAMPEP_0179299818 /NCGR_PEP_ID=MMETSP0797-20121207/46712_1 /TAXON_ID=47934 /ORGANISM="Dinophysis acuminata, Strain DAEP01" /LENGTH=152 /DNA_ID=CAMNT_0021009263 /DNA_START=266 /DNA_END=724 /DNA_ORIENTATION=+